jgi:1-deoxy-D-xylulose-5-phosphate reductoisomerase
MPETPLRLVVLGSTGSIGRQTLDVVDRLRETGRTIEIRGLSAGRNIGLLAEQIERYEPPCVSTASASLARDLEAKLPDTRVLVGEDGLLEVAGLDDVDTVVNGLVGAVGLPPTLKALERGRSVALANKESLVVGGELVREALSAHGGRLIPLDSEHSGLRQCLDAGRREDVSRMILTASGGPFLRTRIEALEGVTAEAALAHPNWAMGSRITVDSATMVNKGFEVIEAHVLFEVPYERIDVVVHPESIVHALVEYKDGSVVAQLAAHDMRIPIQYALTYPERIETELPRLSLSDTRSLEFMPLDSDRFPAFEVVLDAARDGRSAPAAVNAADEVLVARFLRGELPFPGISRGLRRILDAWRAEMSDEPATLDGLLDVDRWAREAASALFV